MINIASTVDQSSSSMNGRAPIPGCAGCRPASHTIFFPLCSMTQQDLPTSWPAPSMVIVSEGASSSGGWRTCTVGWGAGLKWRRLGIIFNWCGCCKGDVQEKEREYYYILQQRTAGHERRVSREEDRPKTDSVPAAE